MKIGKRIRHRRKELELSLRELGEMTGVSASFLSQVENNQVSPSLNSLQSIATALQVPMFYFLSDVKSGSVVRAGRRRTLSFSDSQIGYDLLTPDFSRKMMSFLIHLQPFARRVAMPLAKSTEQWMHVLTGQMMIKVGDDTHILDPGDTIYYDGDALHEFCSKSDEELTIICCITPPAL
jgi:transcriptional regulator with XRE-family HTH domain